MALRTIAGLLEHLPSIALFGAQSVSALPPVRPGHLRSPTPSAGAATIAAPRSAHWSRGRGSVAYPGYARGIRFQPYWLIASALAAIIAGLKPADSRHQAATSNLYGKGAPLPSSLGTAVAWPYRTTPS